MPLACVLVLLQKPVELRVGRLDDGRYCRLQAQDAFSLESVASLPLLSRVLLLASHEIMLVDQLLAIDRQDGGRERSEKDTRKPEERLQCHALPFPNPRQHAADFRPPS